MVEDKIVKRKNEIIKLSKGFCKKYLDREFSALCENLVEDLYNLNEIPFKRGKLEIWASAVVHRIASTNMLFNSYTVPHIQVKDITTYFNTKEPTVYSKSKIIADLFDEDEFNEKYSIMVLTPSDVIALRDDEGKIIKVNINYNENLKDTDKFFDAIFSLHYGGENDKALEMIDTVPKTAKDYAKALTYKAIIYFEEDKDGLNNILKELNDDYPDILEENLEILDGYSQIDITTNLEDPTGGYLITLRLYSETLLWRDVKIPNNITFKHLHNLIQKIFNFKNYHMWEFEVPKKIDDETVDLGQVICNISSDEANNIKISEIFEDTPIVLYRYDMGDNWEIVITKKEDIEYSSKSAEITDYEGKYSPMDDMGGVMVFDEIMEYLDDNASLEDILDDYGMDLSDLEKMDFEKRFKKGSQIKL